jgi:hypothetical protein
VCTHVHPVDGVAAATHAISCLEHLDGVPTAMELVRDRQSGESCTDHDDA